MKFKIVTAIIVVILLAVYLTGCTENESKDGDSNGSTIGGEIVLSYTEICQDLDCDWPDFNFMEKTIGLLSYKEGDDVYIQDQIFYMEYYPDADTPDPALSTIYRSPRSQARLSSHKPHRKAVPYNE